MLRRQILFSLRVFLHPYPRPRDDVTQLALGGPSQHSLSFSRIGHKNRRIAWPPRHNLSPDCRPVAFSAARMTSRTECPRPVPGLMASESPPLSSAFFSSCWVSRCCNARMCASARSLTSMWSRTQVPSGRRVVRSEDMQLGSVLAGGGKRQWNQMSLRIVQFANLAVFIGSRSVEIAQTHRA
jgi:hypothetical protein